MLSFKFLKRHGYVALNNIFEIITFNFFAKIMIKYKNFDIVHSQGCYTGKIDIFTAHSCHAESLEVLKKFRRGLWGKLKKTALNPLHALLLSIEKHNVRHAKAVRAVSIRVKEDIVKHYNIDSAKIDVIPNGVDISKFNPEARMLQRKAVRSELGLTQEDKVIVFPAHEFERKGLAYIIDAVRLIHRKDLFVIITGQDDPNKFLPEIRNKELEKYFIFKGKVDNMAPYYAVADMLVLPTNYEPYGLVITEAMAVGLPVIVSGLAGASDFIKDGVNGILLNDFSDYRYIAKSIRHLLDDPVVAETMGKNARKTAELYPWSVITNKTFGLYEEIVKHKVYVSRLYQYSPSISVSERKFNPKID